MPIATFPLGPLGTNSYLLNSGPAAVAIDVGGDPQHMLEYLAAHKLTLEAICLTHRHFDHLYGVARLAAETGSAVYSPPGDNVLANSESGMGGIWGMPLVTPFESEPMPLGPTVFGGMECVVLETPGHTPGGVSLYFPGEKAVFTGDALFYRSMGRTDFPGGDQEQLLRSIRHTLFRLPDDVTVYPGHGPATSIGDERRHNPFCGEFEE